MCGITGWLNWDYLPDKNIVQRMTNALKHRGPDAEGIKKIGPVVLGHRRLSIIDLDIKSNQPLSDITGNYWIVYNGEIYNYKQLKHQLKKNGSHFKTHSDTEVILELYKKMGDECVSILNGMFAFAIWDNARQRLFLARDRVGEKPLFYSLFNDGSFVFASEPRALRQFHSAKYDIDTDALLQFLSNNYTTGEQTLIKQIRRFPPAHCMVVERNRPPRQWCYWDLAHHFQNKTKYKSITEACDILQDLIRDAVEKRMVSDVPLGAFLSGGIDSSTIVAAMGKHETASNIKTFSVGFSEENYSELEEANACAKFLGVEHFEKKLSPNPSLILQSLLSASDEPLMDSSVLPMHCLANFARQHITVALSGDGADECFAGYETYIADRLSSFARLIPKRILVGMSELIDTLLPVSFAKVSLDFKLKSFFTGSSLDPQRAHCSWRSIFRKSDLHNIMLPKWQERLKSYDSFAPIEHHYKAVSSCHPLDQFLYVDIKTWLTDDILVKVDRMTMANSLESRAPFLDHRLLEFSASLPVKWKLNNLKTKYILKRCQKTNLPGWLINRRKRGFNAPVSNWFSKELFYLGTDLLKDSEIYTWFSKKEISKLQGDHLQGKKDNGLKLLNLVGLTLWLKDHHKYRYNG
jgi:asparagine synthase (glutamine-hydrolysing)